MRDGLQDRPSIVNITKPGLKDAYTMIFSLLLFVIFHCFTVSIQQKLAIDTKALRAQKNIYVQNE